MYSNHKTSQITNTLIIIIIILNHYILIKQLRATSYLFTAATSASISLTPFLVKKSTKSLSQSSHHQISNPEVFTGKRLPELPAGGNHVPRRGGPPVAAGDPERQRLANEDSIRLPVLPPVARHRHPSRFGSLDADPNDVTRTRHVRDQNQVEVLEPVNSESDPTRFPARHPVTTAQKTQKNQPRAWRGQTLGFVDALDFDIS